MHFRTQVQYLQNKWSFISTYLCFQPKDYATLLSSLYRQVKPPGKMIEIRVKVIMERENIIKCFMGKVPKHGAEHKHPLQYFYCRSRLDVFCQLICEWWIRFIENKGAVILLREELSYWEGKRTDQWEHRAFRHWGTLETPSVRHSQCHEAWSEAIWDLFH